MTYSGLASIYFQDVARVERPLPDSTLLSFSFTSKYDSIQPILIAVTGMPIAEDRTYALAILDSSTAVAGIHYDALPQQFTIKKNAVNDTLRIHWRRTPDMKEKAVSLVLALQDNENFVVNMKEQLLNATTGQTKSYTKYRITTHDMITKPSYWLEGMSGTFSSKKFLLMVDILGVSSEYLMNLAIPSEWAAFSQMTQRYLNEQRAAGTIIYEADGTDMIMGPNSQ